MWRVHSTMLTHAHMITPGVPLGTTSDSHLTTFLCGQMPGPEQNLYDL